MINSKKSAKIWVICEQRGDSIADVSLELLSKAAALDGKNGVAAVILGHGASKYTRILAAAGADIIYVFDHFELACKDDCLYARLIASLISKHNPQIVLMGATIHGRSVAPQVAAIIGAGLTADCTGLELEDNYSLVQTRPAYGGSLLAEVITKNSKLQMATVRSGAMPRPTFNYSREFVVYEEEYQRIDNRTPVIYGGSALKQGASFMGAGVIIAGGAGMDAKGFSFLKQLSERLGCAVGASRAAVNAGLAPYSMQIGQTGTIVRPKLYVAIAISGAVQHIAGMRASEYTIAINKDRNAPIFNYADIGIVADYRDVLAQIESEIEHFQRVCK